MANESHLSYGKNTIPLKTAPLAGENLNIYLRPGDELKSSIDLSKAQYQIVGTDVVATLPNGGKITFVSLGMMVFEDNPPIIKLPNDDRLLVTDILNKVQNISQASKDSILTSGDVILQSDEKSDSAASPKKSDEPVVDYNAYYVDPQPNIKPQDEIGPKDNVGKYLTESPSFTSNETSSATSTQNYSSSETQSHSKDNIADVSAALSFDIGFYQIKSSDSTATVASVTTTTVLGGTGSALGNVSKLASAQFEPETIDYRNNPNVQVITADDPTYVTETYLTKLVRMSISQPIGFGITDVAITGLGSGFQILNSNGTSANAMGGGWDLVPGTGFTAIATDGGEIIEFYVKYEPANVTVNTDYLMQVNLTSIFDMNNVPLLMQPGVVVPILNTLTSVKDVGVIVKTVESVSDYTYTGQYSSGYVLDTTPNENIIFTGKLDSTVHGGLSSDTISGNIGNDILDGAKGNDTLSGGTGDNTLIGGLGIDTASYEFITKYSEDFLFANNGVNNDPLTGLPYTNNSKGVVVDLFAGTGTGKSVYDATTDALTGEETRTISDTLNGIEYVIGSKYDDTLSGDGAANKLMGGEGNDTLDGRSGADYLDGGAGNDRLIGSTDDFMIDGGDNTDTVDFSDNSNGIEVALNNSSNGTIINIGGAGATTTKIKNVENVAGSHFKDIITGDNADNLLIGGSTTITSRSGDDTISGGSGADVIVGDMQVASTIGSGLYGGDDLLSGGVGNDIIWGDSAPVLSTSVLVVDANQMSETIVDTNPISHVVTTLSTVVGGNDTLMGGAGDDYLNGGSGFDTVDYTSSLSSVSVDLSTNRAFGDGNDRIFNIENIIGTSNGDTLTGNNLVNTIVAGEGNDTLSGQGGNDTLDGGLDSDWADYSYSSGVIVDLSTTLGTATVTGGGDTDTLVSIENVIGSSGNDTMTVGSGTNTLLGNNGNDYFYALGSGDTIDGGNGSDSVDYGSLTNDITINLGTGASDDRLISIENIYATAYNDSLVGSSDANILDGKVGADTLRGMSGNDTLYGGTGNDILDGGDNDDTLYGGDNNDTLIGGFGTDILDGGLGQNTADYSGVGIGSINVDLSTGIASDGQGAYDTLSNIQIVKGSSSADIMKGSSSADTLIGGNGNDTFLASGGSDTYYGNTGSTPDSYSDKIDYSALGTVNNIFVDLSSASSVNPGLVQLRDNTNATLSTDSLYSVEEVYGTSGKDTMIGGVGLNTLYGGAGDDTLTGTLDGDVLDGASGINLADYHTSADSLTVNLTPTSQNVYKTSDIPTSTNSDTLKNIQNVTTGSGNDTLTGNSANNVLNGGSGNDTADYSTSITSINANLTTGQVVGSATGTDTLVNIENIIGTAQSDIIRGDTNANSLMGLGGNDTIYGGLDGDHIDGGAANEKNTLNYSGLGATTIDLEAEQAHLTASSVVDTITNIQDVIAGSNNDILIGKVGMVNTLFGGDGNDTFTGNMDGDLLDGDIGTADMADYSSNTAKVVDIYAQKIALSISDLSLVTKYDTFTNIEIINTGNANDQFTLTGSSDSNHLTLNGGGGSNTVDYGGLSIGNIVTDLSTVVGGYSTVTVNGSTGDDYIANIKNITGSQNGDTITGDATTNVLHGNGGHDKLDGGAGNDTVYGDTGNDTIIGTIDNTVDYYDGGADSDTIDYSAVTTALALSNGTTVTGGGVGTDTLANIEIFKSGFGSDILSGGTSAMTIYGYDGVDAITGGSGDDLIYGGSSWSATGTTDNVSNVLDGGAGNDKIYAGSAGDTLRGGLGNDTLYGGAGIDTAEYSVAMSATLNTSLVNADGLDVLDIDTIEILRAGIGADVITGADTGILATIYAGAGNDILNGGAINETLYGEVGNDTLRGGDGIDILYAGDGNDLIYGAILTAGRDVIYGGNGTLADSAGSDTLDFSDNTNIAISIVVDMSTQSGVTTAGTAKISGNTVATFYQIENITGGSGADQITGDANANSLNGGGGSDTIFVSNGADAIDGGVGTDTMDFSSRATAVNVNLAMLQILNNGNSEAQTIQNIENLIGGSVGDTLYGDGVTNTIQGGLGADTLKGGDGNDVLYATDTTFAGDGAVSNTLYGEAGNDTLFGAAGADILDGGLGNDTLDGKEGSDILIGGGGNDTIGDSGVAGNDTLSYAGSSKIITAFALSDGTIEITDGTVLDATVTLNSEDQTNVGIDTLSATHGIEMILGSGLSDKFFTQTYRPINEAFTLDGGSGNDTIYGGALNDVVYGGANDDTIRGYGGNNILAGGSDTVTGSGTDTLDYSFDTQGVKVNLTSGFASYDAVAQNRGVHVTDVGISGYIGGTDEVYNFYRVLGGSGTDTIAGNLLTDSINGGAGDDWIVMTTGNDYIDGGTNADFIDYNFIAGSVIVDLSGSVGTGSAGTDDIRNIENVSGSASADTITGNSGVNTLIGRLGNDTISSGAGNDLIYGDNNNANSALNEASDTESGSDNLYGGAGSDTIYGGLGDDYIEGDSGGDVPTGFTNTLYGGGGNDNFGLYNGNDIVYGGSGTDTANYWNSGGIVARLDATYDIGGIKFGTITQGGTTDYISLADVENLSGSGYGDTIYGSSLISSVLRTINGGNGNDFIQGNSAIIAEYIDGGENDDTIEGGGGADTLYGGGGTDLFYGAIDGDTIYGGETNETAGGDTVNFIHVTGTPLEIIMNNNAQGSVKVGGIAQSYFYEIENIVGTNSNDTIVGDIQGNALSGGAGDDTLAGGAGNDAIDGGANTNGAGGGDWIDFTIDGVADAVNGITIDLGNKLQQWISATRGSDTVANIENVKGTANADTIWGDSTGNYAAGSVHTILGMAGDDSIVLRGGNNSIDGGSGIDTVSYSNENGVTLTLVGGGGTATVGSYSDILTTIENIIGSDNNNTALAKDTITGDANANRIVGMRGDDTLDGGAGNDSIEGNSDNDTIYGGAGTDTIDGGAGNDMLYVNTNTLTDSVANTIYGGSGADNIFGSLSGNTLYGDMSAGVSSGQGDVLRYDLLNTGVHVNLSTTTMTAVGWDGTADVLAATDTIGGFTNVRGSGFADKFEGTTGSESIYGGAGNDIFVGNGGADSLYGESGDDSFIFTTVAQMQAAALINGGASSEINSVTLTSHTGNEIITTANMSYIQQLQLAGGSTSLATYTANTNNISILGTTGADYIIGGVGFTNTISGGGGDDVVVFAVGDLLGDIVDGGAHATADTLKITGASSMTDVQFTNVSNFEVLDLSGYSGTSITLGTEANGALGSTGVVNLATTYAAGTSVVVDVSGYGNGLTVNGGTGSDDVIVSIGQILTVNGSTGTADILEFKDAGTISSLSATISGIEQIKFSSLGANNITLDANTLSDAPTLVGGANSDTFNYSITNLTAADKIDGGAGVDTLSLLNAGIIDNTANAVFGGMTNVEIIQLKDSLGVHNTLTMGTMNGTINGGNQGDVYNYTLADLTSADTIFAGTGTDTLAISGGGVFTDSTVMTNLHSIETLNLNGFTGTNATLTSTAGNAGITTVDATTKASSLDLTIASFSNPISVTTSAGSNDVIRTSTNYMANQVLNAGVGSNDTLSMSSGSDVTDAMLANKTNFEVFDISALNANTTITMGANANAAGFTTVQDTSANAKTIDVHGDARTLAVNAGTGVDTIIVNNAAQNAVINGGATGINTLSFYNSLTGGQAGSAGVIGNVTFSNIQKIQLANTGNDVTFDASAMGVTLIGGSGIDIFRYAAANFTAFDTIDGGNGNDTLLYTTNSNAITGADFTNLTSIETLQLADGGNTVSAYNYTYGTLVGGSGVDAISITSGASSVKIDGAAGNDVFTFANATDMTNATTIIGNSGTDTVVVNGTTDITAASFAKLATVETVNISALNANATLGTAAQIEGIVTVTDTGSFVKTIDASTFGNNILAINANGGSDVNDTVILDSAQTTVSVNLGSSTGDTLSLSGATTVTDSFFSNKQGIETLNLTNGTMSNVTLGTNANTTGIKTVTDAGSNAKTIDVSGDAIGLTVNAGTGVDIIIVDSTKTYTIDGGNAENNTLKLSNQLTTSETGSATVIGNVNYSSVTTVQLADGGNTVAFDLYSGSGTNISLLGGMGNDVFKYAIAGMAGDSLLGGAGNDTLFFTDSGTIVQASLSGVDTSTANKIEVIQFADGVNAITVDKDGILLQGGNNADTFNYAVGSLTIGDTIDGGSGTDILALSGGAVTDVQFTNLSSIETLNLTAITAGSSVTLGTEAAGAGLIAVNGNTGGMTLDVQNFGNSSLGIALGASNDTLLVASTQTLVTAVGGATGTDTLKVVGSGVAIGDALLANKTGFEVLDVASLSTNSTVTLVSAASGFTSISESSGTNQQTIDVSGYLGTLSSGIALTSAGAAGDTVKVLSTQNIAIAGGSATNDTLQITNQISSGGISATGLGGIEKIQLGDFTNSVTMNYDNKTFIGGSADDTFQYSVGTFSTTDSLNGGTAGTDTLLFSDASTSISGANFGSNLTGIDIIQLANGVNTVSSYAYTAGTLIGGNGVDTITVTAGTNGAKINTGTGVDIVNVSNVTDLNNTTINGGDSLDKVVITTTSGGIITAANITNIAEIDLASGGSAYTINTATSIVGSTGNDSIIGGASVNNTISAGLGDDTVEFDIANLDASDKVWGGNVGNDTLKITGTGNLGDAILANIREFEVLDVTSLVGNVTLAGNATTAGITSITDTNGASSAKIIDVTLNTSVTSITAAGGADTIKINGSSVTTVNTGGGDDTINATSTQSVSIDGGTGINTLNIQNTGTISAINATLNSIQKIQFADATNDITVNKDNISLIGGIGNDTFNYNATDLSGTDYVDGGSGAGVDTLKITGNAALIDSQFAHVVNIEKLDLTGYTNGGVTLSTNADNNTTLEVLLGTTATTVDAIGFTGNITITGNATATDDTIKLNSSDFTSGDHIAADGGNDTLVLSGSTNFVSTDFANVSGIETLDMSTFAGTTVTMFADASGKFNTYTSSNLAMTIDASAIAGGTFNLGTGNDNFTVGSGTSTVNANTGVNTVSINSANLDSTDVITSGVGITDTLVVTGSTALSTSNFGTITGFEKLDLSGYFNNITVDSTLAAKFTTFTTKSGQTLTIDIADISGKTIDGAGDVVITMGATSSQSLAAITATGTQTLKFTADATYTGASIGSVDVIDVASSTTATLNASLISAKTLTFSGSGNMTINADNTAANNNFGSITDSISGTVSLNYSGGTALDLSGTNIGTTLVNTFNTSSATVTLSAAQAGNITSITGNGSLSVTGALGADLNLVTKGYTGNVTIADANGHNVTLGNGTNHITDNTTTANVITGGTGSDTVHVTSSVDVSAKTFSGIETLALGANSVIIDSADAAAISTSITGNGNLSVTGALGANLDLSVTGKNYTGNVTIVNANGHDVTLGVGSDNITNTIAGGTLDAGAGNDTYNVSVATNIADTGDIDILNTTATMDLSGKVSGIETLNVAFGTTTTLNYGDIGTSGISILSGLGSVSIHGTTTMDIHTETVSLGADKLGITGTAFADSLVLDFSQLSKIQFDGGTGTDTVSFFGTNAATLNDLNAFTNIEKLDIHSLGLSGGGLAIDANSLYAFTGTNAGFSFELDAAATDLSNSKLSIDGLTSWKVDGGTVNTGSSFILSAGDAHHYSLTTSTNTITDLYVHAL